MAPHLGGGQGLQATRRLREQSPEHTVSRIPMQKFCSGRELSSVRKSPPDVFDLSRLKDILCIHVALAMDSSLSVYHEIALSTTKHLKLHDRSAAELDTN